MEVRRRRKATNPLGVSCKYREENSRSNQCTGDFARQSSGNSDAARDWCQPADTRRAVETIERFNMGPVRLRKLKKVEDSLHTFEYGPYDCTLDLRSVPGVFRAVYRKTGCVSVYREI